MHVLNNGYLSESIFDENLIQEVKRYHITIKKIIYFLLGKIQSTETKFRELLYGNVL